MRLLLLFKRSFWNFDLYLIWIIHSHFSLKFMEFTLRINDLDITPHLMSKFNIVPSSKSIEATVFTRLLRSCEFNWDIYTFINFNWLLRDVLLQRSHHLMAISKYNFCICRPCITSFISESPHFLEFSTSLNCEVLCKAFFNELSFIVLLID